MQEEFLHYVWKFGLFNTKQLATTDGQPLEILGLGEHNHHSGPDFFNAKIKYDATTWAGNVEMHLQSSDWNKHKHSLDEAYNNVILHVVYVHDQEIRDANGRQLPTLELNGRISKQLLEKYLELQKNRAWIPCEKQVDTVGEFIRESWLSRLLVERLERKSGDIQQLLADTKNNWAETFYRILARNFGFKINADPFGWLATSLPLSVLSKHKDNLFQLEAMLFGQAGLLDSGFVDGYPAELQREYQLLRTKFKLVPLEAHVWKFMRLRPSNFPTVRIAQLAMLIHQSQGLFSKVTEAQSIREIKDLFEVATSRYWQTHYTFDKISNKRIKHLGENSVNTILINTVVPFLFIYGRHKGNTRMEDRAIRFLDELAGDKNTVISKWEELGFPVHSAYYTQALLELKSSYCNQKKCLNCGIGNQLLKEKSDR